MKKPLLSVKNLKTCFGASGTAVPAVDDVSFDLFPGETFALVGESGSGKSVTALSVLRLLPPNGRVVQGEAVIDGADLFKLPETKMCEYRGRRIAIVFQDPMTSLNPVMTIGAQIAEVLLLHRGAKNGAQARNRVMELLNQVGIPEPERRIDDYPHQLSGGQRQRVTIAIALAGGPDLLIADEPTTALDVTIQAQILKLLKDLQIQTGMALWLITHDFGIVSETADHIAVMQEGKIVEQARRDRFFKNPSHPYTRKLFDALPSLDGCLLRKHPASGQTLLELEDFKVYYPIRKGLFKRVVGHVKAVDGVSFKLEKGSTLALVGESGCGKTTLGKALLQLIPDSGGVVRFDGTPLKSLRGEALRKKRAEMQIVFQDPFSSMNPRMLVEEIIEEGMRSLMPGLSVLDRRRRVEKLLEQVGLPANARLRYPHEFSGGQRQRICIARALAVNPRLIVCDEPTSSLDVSVQAQILNLLRELQEREHLSYLFISHNLSVVAELADEVAVMYRGKIVEMGPAADVLKRPSHAYTQQLIKAVPKVEGALGRRKLALHDPAAAT